MSPGQALNPDRLLAAAMRIVSLLDRHYAAEIWAKASCAARKQLSESDFAEIVTKTRQQMGLLPFNRQWVRMHQVHGAFAGVEFETTSSDEQTVLEMATFRCDEDGVWRLSGYAIKQSGVRPSVHWLDNVGRDAWS